jgi:hypothetical protein
VYLHPALYCMYCPVQQVSCRKYPGLHKEQRPLAAAMNGGPAPPDRRWEKDAIEATRVDELVGREGEMQCKETAREREREGS